VGQGPAPVGGSQAAAASLAIPAQPS
jgi:hypothetical protein